MDTTRRRMGTTMMIFKVTYSDSEYLQANNYESLVVARDFIEAMQKWHSKFYDKPKARMISVELFWEFPIM
jgi:hypothetical protein